jgi:N-acetylglucosaminyldiphosphoundecaprenol N-acetyl-beta-D-mannosaminyltransferase
MVESRKPRGVAILGVAIDNLTMHQLLDAVESQIAEGGFHQIATANVDFIVNSVRDEELREVLSRCDIVLPDGMPLVWASRLLGVRLGERVAGADLVPRLTKLSAERGYRIFLLGASEESSAGTSAWMRRNFAGVCIAGRYSPRIQPLEEMDHEYILACIEEARPDILLVAFGNPKQEKWIAMHRNRLKVPVCIGVGGSFEFLSGRIRRAPVWMQQNGLEWLYRTIQEPSRLAKRYFFNAAALLRYLPAQLVWMAVQSKPRTKGQITTATVGKAKILRIHGDLTGPVLPQFDVEVSSAILSGLHVVLDLSQTTYIGADALGSLIHVMNLARRWWRDLWIAGTHPNLVRVFHAAQLRPFRMASKVSEALRRIEADLIPVSQLDEDSTFIRVRGQLIPVCTQEMPELYRQVQMFMQTKVAVDTLPIASSDSQ